MAMASAYPAPQMINPRYKGTVVCGHCRAEYTPGNWVYGFWENTVSTCSNFMVCGKIPDDQCPICRREPQGSAG